MQRPTPTSVERFFDRDEIIVSKTDLRGKITYANSVFLKVAGYSEAELLGAPHSIVRHPDMPRAVFQLLWDTIMGGREIFAYVKNMARSGDFYWVFAHVTPTFDAKRQIVGFHSNRRLPERHAIRAVEGVYAEMRAAEARVNEPRARIAASTEVLQNFLAKANTSYEELMFAL